MSAVDWSALTAAEILAVQRSAPLTADAWEDFPRLQSSRRRTASGGVIATVKPGEGGWWFDAPNNHQVLNEGEERAWPSLAEAKAACDAVLVAAGWRLV